MNLRFRCGNCKEDRPFLRLKRDDFTKKYVWATLVSCESCNFIYCYCSSCDGNKSRQQSNKHLILNSRVCRHDSTYHTKKIEIIVESDSDEVSNNQ